MSKYKVVEIIQYGRLIWWKPNDYVKHIVYQDLGVVRVDIMGAVRAVNLRAVVILEELGDGGTVRLGESKPCKKIKIQRQHLKQKLLI